MKAKTKTATVAAKTEATAVAEDATHIPLSLLMDNEDLNKSNRPIDTDWVDELLGSIKTNGLDTPVQVWRSDDMEVETDDGTKVPAHFLVAGFHRRAALRKFETSDKKGFAKMFPHGIPVIVRVGDMADALAAQVRENVDRKEPSSEELLPQLLRLKDEFGLKNRQIAQRIGRSDGYVSRVFEVAKLLGEEATQKVVSGKMSMKAAKKAAAKVKAGADPEQAVAAAEAEDQGEKAAGRERSVKRLSLKKLYQRYQALPGLAIGAKITILEKAVEYVLDLPKSKVPVELRKEIEPPATMKAKAPVKAKKAKEEEGDGAAE